jgi:chromate transporter
MTAAFGGAEWAALGLHFLSLSLLAVGGAIVTAPDMHRYLVGERGWISDAEFVASIAIAQAAPGPNLLFVALLGWHVGLHAAGAWGAALGVTVAMAGTLLPSTLLTLGATRWVHRRRDWRGVRAFKQGLAPVVVALILATAVVLMSHHAAGWASVPVWLLAITTALVMWRTRLHLLWLLALGALLGALGWV